MRLPILIIFCFISYGYHAQPFSLEELEQKLEEATTDTIKIDVLNALGTHYYRISNHSKAVQYFLKARDLAEEVGDSNRIASYLINHGTVFYYLQDFDRAAAYFIQSIPIIKKYGTPKKMASVLTNIGALNQVRNELDSALYYYDLAYQTYLSLEDTMGVAVTTCNMGILYDETGQYNKAREAFDISTKLYIKLNRRYELALNYYNYGLLYENLSQYHLAIDYFLKSMSFKNEGFVPPNPQEVYAQISACYEKLGNIDLALTYYKRFHEMSDSINDEAREVAIEEIQLKYENDRKEQQLAELRSEKAANEKISLLKDKALSLQKEKTAKSRKFNWTLLILSGVLIIGLVAILMLFQRIRIANKEIKHRAQKIELRALQAQINPHFIFNSLNSIQKFIINNEMESSLSYLGKFSKLMRTTLKHSDEEWVVMKDELDALNDYVELERLRLDHPLDFTIHIDNELNPHNILIPPLLLQPLVENAIWHGVSYIIEPGKIDLQFKRDQDFIEVVLSDNGHGIQQDISAKRKYQGVRGLSITRSRIGQIWRTRGKSFHLDIRNRSEGRGVEVSFKLPIVF